jgi:molybdate transport system substrate-binding protein
MRMCASIVLLTLAACGGPEEPGTPVTVYAAASLKEAVTEIAGAWSKGTGRPHRLTFEATSTLARQIQEGAPADVFITAAPEWLDKVKPQERYDWLSNRLVVVVPKDAAGAFDLKAMPSLALANEQVPAGKYAREALKHLGVALPERMIYGQNVRDVLSKVSEGGASAGIVYATDAAMDAGVRVVHTFPPESHAKIVYSVGLLKPEGKALFDAFRAPEGIAVAVRRGFSEAR